VTDAVEQVGSITATWTDPLGVVWELSNTAPEIGWFTPPGPAGWSATSYEIVTDPMPRGGETVRFIRSKPATVSWPLYVYGDTHLQFVDRYRQIKRAFAMTLHRRTVGTLRVARPDGTAREIDAYYQDGFTGESGENWLWAKAAISLFCPDGYWRDVDPVTILRNYVAGANYLAPFPQVSDSLALGETVLNNPGDVDAWPTWTITGPATAISATNITTGYEFTITYTLLANEQITITTQQPTVRGPYGQNLVSALDWPNAYLWSLLPGDNDVIFNVSGASAGTSVQLDFHARYEGA
jgi:hypothetical protein